jgi:hypothetical protein
MTSTGGITARAADVLHVAVGLGILGVQRTQVKRREISASISDRLEVSRTAALGVLDLADEVDGSIDDLVGAVAGRLPTPAGGVLTVVHGIAKSVRTDARERLRERLADDR